MLIINIVRVLWFSIGFIAVANVLYKIATDDEYNQHKMNKYGNRNKKKEQDENLVYKYSEMEKRDKTIIIITL